MKILHLKKNEERRILAGNLWIYSNEIDTKISPLKQFQAGELVVVKTQSGKPLGIAYINPQTLLCCRLLTKNHTATIDVDFFIRRIEQALEIRQICFTEPFYRLIFSESDNLPGLIVDRFANDLVVQITTAGMENFKSIILEALIAVLKPNSILLRNDSSIREIEGLDSYVEAGYGTPPQTITLREHGATFNIPIWEGQKTGWFFDQSFNRARLQTYVKNRRVLDVFSYIGAWGIQAALLGATEVTCVDSSAAACEKIHENAILNNVAIKISTICDDAFAALKQLIKNNELFDVVIIDPPAFIKKRKDIKEGTNAYQRLHALALKLIKNSGVLFSTSCSQHLSREMLHDVIRRSGINAQCELRIIENLQQAQDHPIHTAIPETEYLKGFVVFKNRSKNSTERNQNSE